MGQNNQKIKTVIKYVMLAVVCSVLGTSYGVVSEAANKSVDYGMGGGEAGSGGGEAGSGGGDGFGAFTNAADDGFYNTCANAVGVLRRALRMAQYQNGNFASIRRLLVDGLANALREIPSHEDPLTKSAIRRGLTLNQQFINGCKNITDPTSKAQCLDLELRTAVFFLDRFYSYILNFVYPLDANYWIPYRTQYPRCRSYNCLPSSFYSAFYAAYKDSARELLNFYIGNRSNGMPYALAMDVYELHVAENVLKWSANDLNLDLFRRNFACLIGDLAMAAQDLADFNTGSTMVFRNSRQAVNFARNTADSSASALGGYVCGYRY